MKGERIYMDDQGGMKMQVLKEDVSPCILLNGAKGHSLIVCERKQNVLAFAQNTREEVRILGEDGNVAGCVSAESGTHQTTYVCIKKGMPSKKVPCRTKTKKNWRSTDGSLFSVNPKFLDSGAMKLVCPTLLSTSYKEPPIVFKKNAK